MARAKQAAAAAGKKRPRKAPSAAPKPPKKRPPPSGAPSPWEKLRLARKKTPKLLPEAFFAGLVRGSPRLPEGFGVQGAAVAALREGCEAHLLALLEEWGLCALHAKRAAVRRADVSLVRCLRVKRG